MKNLSKQFAKNKLKTIKTKYNLTDNEKIAIDKGINALSLSQNICNVIEMIEDLPIREDEDGEKFLNYHEVMHYLSKCKYLPYEKYNNFRYDNEAKEYDLEK